MYRKLLFATAVSFGLSCTAKPFAHWDFEKWERAQGVSRSSNILFHGKPTPGSGYKDSTGIRCDNKKFQVAKGVPCADWRAFTMELKFKLDPPPKKKGYRTLFSCAKTTYNSAAFVVRINMAGQIEAAFNLSTKKIKKKLVLCSEKLDLTPGTYYTLRAASQSGGALKLWLNGKLIAFREKGSWGFNDLVYTMPMGYPLMTVGYDLIDPSCVCRPMYGYADEFKIWNKFAEPDVLESSAGSADDHLLTSENLPAVTTSRFHVADRPGRTLGTFIRPEKKFLDAAATAQVQLTAKDLIVKIHCPVASGTQVRQKKTGVWGGDLVEFFLRPNKDKGAYFQYASNASGESTAIFWKAAGTAERSFKSKAVISAAVTKDKWTGTFVIPRKELGLESNAPRTVTVNFTRTGTSGGGTSSWSLLRVFNAIDKFQPLVLGSRKQVLLDQFQKSQKEFDSIKHGGALRKTVAQELARLKDNIVKNGDKAVYFTALSRAVANMQQRYTQLHFANEKAMFWKTPLPWENRFDISSLTRKIKKITVTLPMNSSTWQGFVFSNLSDKPFLGQIKCFSSDRDLKNRYNYFNSFKGGAARQHKYQQTPLNRNVQFFEALPLDSGAGDLLYDPLIPLPMNTILRAGVRESKLLMMRISSKDMKPGKHRFIVFAKPAVGGFEPMEFLLELDIRPVDCSKIALDAGHYSYLYGHGLHGTIKNFFGERDINMYLGGIGGSLNNYYPKIDKEGNILAWNDYKKLDEALDKLLAGGVKKSRLTLVFGMQLSVYGLAGRPASVRYNSPAWNRAFKAFLAHFTAHLKKKYGVGLDRIIFSTVDEPEGDINDKKSLMYQALLQAQIIKNADKRYLTMTNPHPRVLAAFAKNDAALKKLLPYYDIIEIYRGGATPEIIRWAQKSGKIIWSYNILGKTVPPAVYRRCYWQNIRDNFSEVVRFWQLEGSDNNDGFSSIDGINNRVDYGSIYVDRELGTWLSGRRQEAHDLGREDYRLAAYCRKLLKKSPRYQKEFDTIIRAGADGSMEDMEQARIRLLDLAEKLQKKERGL